MGISRPDDACLVFAWDVGMRMHWHVAVVAIQFEAFNHTRPVGRRALRITSSDAQRPRRARLLTGRCGDRDSFTQLRCQLAVRTTS
jgi:hypothetical protein